MEIIYSFPSIRHCYVAYLPRNHTIFHHHHDQKTFINLSFITVANTNMLSKALTIYMLSVSSRISRFFRWFWIIFIHFMTIDTFNQRQINQILPSAVIFYALFCGLDKYCQRFNHSNGISHCIITFFLITIEIFPVTTL